MAATTSELGVFQGPFEFIKPRTNFQSKICWVLELWVLFRVGLGAKANTTRKQHLISAVWYISLSRDLLSRFRTSYLGKCHGQLFCSFWCIYGNFPEAISPWGNRSHTNSCFPMGNSHLPMGKSASVTAPITHDDEFWLSGDRRNTDHRQLNQSQHGLDTWSDHLTAILL